MNVRPANDCRIDCKTATDSDGDGGAPPCSVLRLEMRAACRPSSGDGASRPLGRRANKRRFDNLLQRLGGPRASCASEPNGLYFIARWHDETRSYTFLGFL